LRDRHPGVYRHPKGRTPAVGHRVDLALASVDDLGMGGHVSPLFKFPEHGIDGALGGRTTAVRGAFNGARDLVAVHWARLQHTQNEKLGETHLDEAIPIRAVGVVHGLSAWSLCLRDRKSTRLNSSHDQISYAVFCLKKK